MDKSPSSLCAVYNVKDSSADGETKPNGKGFEDCSVRLLYCNVPDEFEPQLRPVVQNRVCSGASVPGVSAVFHEKLECANLDDVGVYIMSYGVQNDTLITIVLLHDKDILLAFHNQIDLFCNKKHKQLLLPNSNVINASVAEELGRWYFPCVDYLSRAIKILTPCLSNFLYACLNDCVLTFADNADGDSPCESDIIRLYELCKLGVPLSEECHNSCIFSYCDDSKQYSCSIQDRTAFTDDWAHVILKMVGGASPASVKDLVVNLKQRALRDVNNVVRLIALAHNDHYALFRCVAVARSTNNAPLLIALARRQYTEMPTSMENMQSLRVLSVIEHHLTHASS